MLAGFRFQAHFTGSGCLAFNAGSLWQGLGHTVIQFSCMYVCMYVCIHIYIYIFIHTHIHTTPGRVATRRHALDILDGSSQNVKGLGKREGLGF